MKDDPFVRRICSAAVLAVFLALGCCAPQKKLSTLKEAGMSPDLSPQRETALPPVLANPEIARDTLKVTGDDGREVHIMKAVRDENGEMVASDVIDAAVVSARFSNVAERHGEVNLAFRVRIPAAMRDSRWQIRLNPELAMMGDTVSLDPVILTGKAYRRAQLRGYQHYERFVSRIISDTASFIRVRDLEIFLKRNLPEFYAFRNDSSFVSEERVLSAFGVSGPEAIDHYTDHLAMRLNEKRKGMKDKMFRRYVKSPILKEGVRLDSVSVDESGDFVYDYVQTVRTRPGLRKAEITLQGGIWEQDRHIYTIPPGEPVVFYISSLATLCDRRERYLLKIIERRVDLHTACYVAFRTGSSVVEEDLDANADEIGRIKENLREVLSFTAYEIDSVAICAFASPEGLLASNNRLAESRGRAISAYFDRFLDSLRAERGGIRVDSDGVMREHRDTSRISFVSRSGGENWTMLDVLVETDTLLTETEKRRYAALREIPDADIRERRLSREPYYRHLRQHLYPRLRTVRFDFHLHRRDMQKDTLVTTVPDTVYRRGLQALMDMDYRTALALLGPYRDFNTALAFAGMGRNASALDALDAAQQGTAASDYLRALLCCREGRLADAVAFYRRACSADPSFLHRGNLDPEIASLVKLYKLNN